MIRFATILLTGLLLLPFIPATADAKATSTAPQVHVVKQGDSLYEIANRHGLTVNQLKRLNGLNSNRLKIGQKLALTKAAAPPLPQTAKGPSPRKPAVAHQADDKSVHVVKKEDSLYSIARRHGTTVEQLKQSNNLHGNQLKIGQKLALSGQAEREVVARHETVETPGRYAATEQHVVRKGETLASIARRHHMKVSELKRLNGLRSNNLKIGQRLALNDPYEERNPILLPGDASDDEVLEMAYTNDSELEQVAFNFLSTPYRFGGNSRKGIDCSAFVQQVFREMDVDLPRSAREQFRVGEKIERDELQKGDLIFFRTYAKFPSHVGIYLGDGKMIHASSRSRRVVVTSIDHPYYRKRFIGAKRITLLDDTLNVAGVTQEDDSQAESLTVPVETAAEATAPVATTAEAATLPAGTAEAVQQVKATAPASSDQNNPPAASVN